jgi:hypothetical protein
MSNSAKDLSRRNPRGNLSTLLKPTAGAVHRAGMNRSLLPQIAQQILPPQSAPGLVSGPASGAAAGPAVEMTSILIFGLDHTLLQTRHWILSRHGYATQVATDLSEVERGLAEDSIRLLILCYTLNEHQCDRALALGHSCPGTQILLLAHGNCTGDGASEVLNVFEGPEELLSAVDKLMHGSIGSNSHAS